jgi:hypothetical protein
MRFGYVKCPTPRPRHAAPAKHGLLTLRLPSGESEPHYWFTLAVNGQSGPGTLCRSAAGRPVLWAGGPAEGIVTVTDKPP